MRSTKEGTMRRLIAVGAFLSVVLAVSLPALAHHKPDHSGGAKGASAGGSDHDGDADSSSATTMEDPHTADAGDNHHPSGKDKSYEAGGSGNQGKSESDPDGTDNGGVDKPGGSATAGGDLDDQDGNNGCGNDDDFEDDNNGNCFRRGQQPGEVGGGVGGGGVGGGGVGGGGVGGGGVGGGGVGGGGVGGGGAGGGGAGGGGAVGGETVTRGGAVLGVSVTRGAGVGGQALAVTGLEVQGLLVLALGLLIAGSTIVLVTRRTES
ncbi:MAG TPA: hypothetical protein VGR49_04285 [Actinomycetota bacterium]|nr:hypothetical protein [Actinomycetota bacterium]